MLKKRTQALYELYYNAFKKELKLKGTTLTAGEQEKAAALLAYLILPFSGGCSVQSYFNKPEAYGEFIAGKEQFKKIKELGLAINLLENRFKNRRKQLPANFEELSRRISLGGFVDYSDKQFGEWLQGMSKLLA